MVWKAISSITPMIWPIWLEDFSMAPMASTAWLTIEPEASAALRARSTTLRARVAPSAVRRTVLVISSRAATASSRLAAWRSVRPDRSSAAAVISAVPPWIAVTAPSEAAMTPDSFSTATLKSMRSFS